MPNTNSADYVLNVFQGECPCPMQRLFLAIEQKVLVCNQGWILGHGTAGSARRGGLSVLERGSQGQIGRSQGCRSQSMMCRTVLSTTIKLFSSKPQLSTGEICSELTKGMELIKVEQGGCCCYSLGERSREFQYFEGLV